MLKRVKDKYTHSKKHGQATLEYIILLAVVLAILLVFLQPGGVFQTAINQTWATGTQGMTNMASHLANSHGG